MATERLPPDSEIAFERGFSSKRAPQAIIRLVYDRPIGNTNRQLVCRELFGSQSFYEARWKHLEEKGCRVLLCHRYLLEVKP